MRRAVLLAFLAAFLPGSARAAFVEYGSPQYSALKEVVERTGDRGPVQDRLRRSMPITEFQAKELAQAYVGDARLLDSYKKAIADAFPPESKPVDTRYAEISGMLKDMDKKIDEVGKKLDVFEAGMRKGLLSGRSRPSVLFSLSADLFSQNTWWGLGGHRGSRGIGGSGIWTEWTTGGDGYNLYFVMMFYSTWIDFTAAHLSFFFDNAVLPGIEVQVANEDNYPALSNLIFSGGDGFYDDFKDLGGLGGRRELVKTSPGFGARGGQDIYLRRKSSGDWWPFSDTQFIATQTYRYFGEQYKLNDVAGNVKIRGLPLFWPLERTEPSFAAVWTANDEADLNGWGTPNEPNQSASAISFGLNSSLAGGGTLYFEAATAEYQHASLIESYRDFAVQTVLSKSIHTSAIVLDFQHTGPDFFPGTRNDPSGNFVNVGRTDNRPGKSGTLAWSTNSEEPSAPAGNSDHLALGVTLDFSFTSVGITLGTNKQIEASGPWLMSVHSIGWPNGSQYRDNEGGHGLKRGVDLTGYNGAETVADIYGTTMPVRWTSASNNIRETIILTRSGVGDTQIRDDSIKYLNYVNFNGDFNFQSLFDLKLPFLLKYSIKLRNTDEAFGIPSYTDKALLTQIASHATVNVELPANFKVTTAIGYEDWLSRATFVPVNYNTIWGFIDVNKQFPLIMNGFSIGPRIAYLRHYDSYYAHRFFEAWSIGVGSGTSF